MNLFTNDPEQQWLAARVMGVYASANKLAYLEVTPSLTIKSFSPNVKKILEIDDTTIKGQPLVDVLCEFIGIEDVLSNLLAGKQAEYLIEQVNREQTDGPMRYYTLRIIPLSVEKPTDGLFVIIEDVTSSSILHQQLVQERNELRLVQGELARTNEALEQLNRFKSFLISMASHDLRSPLTTIGGYAELLVEEWPELDLQQHNMLSIIRSQTDQLNQMLTALLDLDQIEQGKLTIKPIYCDLSALVTKEVLSQQPLSERRGQKVDIELPEKPVHIEADPNRIRQVIQNLLANAIKYTPRGKQIVCSLEVEAGSQPTQVTLKIADTGRGMSEEEQKSLFEIYYRTKEARLSKIGGRGLGLFIVKTLVEAHHGQIEVTSEVGKGSTFTVSMPIRQPNSIIDK